ncbi:MAG: ferrochelatase [Pseudomonadota bacterium]
MSRFRNETAFRHDATERMGVLLVNLGTPDEPTTKAVRRYLAEFLWDPRVVEVPRPLWWLILHLGILPFRPSKSAEAYREIWTDKGSPLLHFSRRQALSLDIALGRGFAGPTTVTVAMRYGNPSIPDALRSMQKKNVRRLLIVPMFPQYSATTTASVFGAVTRELATWRRIPEVRFVNEYHDHPAYINALALSIRRHWDEKGRGDKLLMSFHGIPKRYLLAGDPYHCQCHKTARLLADALELAPSQWQISFQSRLGREEWLKPYTDTELEKWADAGVKKVDVVCPGFPADCLETLEDVAMQYQELFVERGGESLTYIPCLNDDTDHIAFLAALVHGNTRGWPEGERERDMDAVNASTQRRLQRARSLGAER